NSLFSSSFNIFDSLSKIYKEHHWSEAMKHTEHYRMYAELFRIDVPLTQSQPTESTQGMYRTPSAPRSLNPKMDAAESILQLLPLYHGSIWHSSGIL
nr:hypothetical protein [Tanacetum cinerariifolium]